MKKLLTLLLILFAAAGCRTPRLVTQTIAAADSLRTENPDSALRLMRSIDSRRVRSLRDKATYGLVYSQVLDKNCIDIDRDTLIRPSVRYYTEHGTPLQQALAYYYWGRTLENADSTVRAIEAFASARRALGDDTLCRTYALICNRLGDAHEAQYEFESAARMFRSSVNTFAALGERYNELIGCQRITANAIMRSSYQEADKWNGKSHILAQSLNDTAMLISIAANEAVLISRNRSNSKKAAEQFMTTCKLYNYSIDKPELIALLCNLYLDDNQIMKARYYLEQYENNVKSNLKQLIAILEIKANIEEKDRNYKKSSMIRNEIIKLQDKLYAAQKKISIDELIRKFDYTIIQRHSETGRIEHHYRLLIGSLVALLLIFSCVWLLIKRIHVVEQQKIHIEEQRLLIENFKTSEDALTYKLNIQEQTHGKLKDVLENRFEQIRNLACTWHLYENSKNLKEKIDNLVFDGNIFHDIEEMVDIFHDDIMHEIRLGTYGKYSEYDYRLLSMILFGFSIQECQIFMGYTSDNLYARRCRIRQKLKMSKGPKTDFLLSIFKQ